jgi:hypothetical protein
VQSAAEPSIQTLGWALVALQILMGLSAMAMGWWVLRTAQAGRRAGQWPPPGVRLLRSVQPVSGSQARMAALSMMLAGAGLLAAGGYLVYLAFRFGRVFGVW